MAPEPWCSRLGNPGETGASANVAPDDPGGRPSAFTTDSQGFVCIDIEQNIYTVSQFYVKKVDQYGVTRWITDARGRVNKELPDDVDGVACQPALLGDALYYGTAQGVAVALVLETGKAKWASRFGKGCFGDGCATAARRDTVIMVGREEPATAVDGQNTSIFALKAATGALLWQHRVQVFLLCCVPAVVSDAVLVQSLPANVECLFLKDGKLKWQQKGEVSPGTTGGVAVSERLRMAFSTANRKGRKSWNFPFGGNGVVRAFMLADGSAVWERPFNLEANVTPAVAPVGPNGKSVVIVGLGSSPGVVEPESQRSGNMWASQVVALDAKSGDLIWTFPIPLHEALGCNGCSPHRELRCTVVTAPVCGADGSVYFGTMAGFFLVLDGATGKRKSLFVAKEAVISPPAIGPGMVVITCMTGMCPQAFCWKAKQAAPGQVLLPLDRPFAASGLEHFWPSKQGPRLTHPCTSPATAPRNLEGGPTWTFQFEDPKISKWYRRELGDFTHKTPVVDAQSNIYIETHRSPLWILRPDGKLRGFLRLGHSLSNPALNGRSLYVANAAGWAFSVDLETLKVNWSTKFALNSTPDSWNVTVCDPPGLVFVMGENDPPTVLSALSASDGEVMWKFPLTAAVYNFLPSVWVEEDMFVFCDSGGGIYCLQISDGKPIWENIEAQNKPSFSTGYCVGAPNGLVYNAWNKGPLSEYSPGLGRPNGGVGLVRAYERKTGVIRWTREFDGLEANNAPTLVPRPTEKGGGTVLVVPLGSNASCETEAHGDEWVGLMCGLDGETGEDIWSWEPPLWKWPGAKGPRLDVDGEFYNPDSWSNPPVLGADGTMYCQWHNGNVYAFDPFTGEKFSFWNLPDCGESGIPVTAPGLLALPGGLGLKVFRDPQLEDAWRAAAKADGDPRAATLREAGEPVGTGCTAAEEDCWGIVRIRDVDLPEEVWSAWVEHGQGRFDEMVAAAQAAKEAKAAAKAKPAAARPAGPKWVVVGGKTTGGIMVKRDKDLKSPEVGRLSTGAALEQRGELEGDRLHFTKLTGDGPDTGWVSLSFKGNTLVKREDQ